MLSPYLESVKKAAFAEELRCHRKGWDENRLEMFGIVADGERGLLGAVWSNPRLCPMPLPAEIHQGGAGVSAKIEQLASFFARTRTEPDALRGRTAHLTQLATLSITDQRWDRPTNGYVRGLAVSSEGWSIGSEMRVRGRLVADTVGAVEGRTVCAVDLSGEVLHVYRYRGGEPLFRRTHVAYDKVGMPKAIWSMIKASGFTTQWAPPNRADHPDMDFYLDKIAKEAK